MSNNKSKIGFVCAQHKSYMWFVKANQLAPRDIVFIDNSDKLRGEVFDIVFTYLHDDGLIPKDIGDIEYLLKAKCKNVGNYILI